jgi:hypothetical protein
MKMMNFGKLAGAAMMSVFLLSLAACQKPEGPAERAGKGLDQAMDKAGQNIEKAGDSIQDTAKGEKK